MPTDTIVAVGLLVLLGISLALLVPIAIVAWWEHRQQRPRAADLQAELAEWIRHAAVVAERAELAAAEAEVARHRVEEAEEARAEAWSALELAERAYGEAARTHREVLRCRAEHPVDPSAQREVANAALAAYRRGDLSQEELWRVWRWGSGWYPEQDRCEHELTQLRAAQRDAHLRYRAAAGAERVALQVVRVAEAQARALVEEVTVAAHQVAAVRAR